MIDCQRCGACCVNRDANRVEGFRHYIEVEDQRSVLLRRADLRKKYVVEDEDGVPHLRLDPSHRCAALKGKLGQHVTCLIYAHRPGGCRRLEPGSDECLAARAERGIETPPLYQR